MKNPKNSSFFGRVKWDNPLISLFRNIFFSIQMHYVLKRMRKSITLDFRLVYNGNFIVHKSKKYHLNLPNA